MESIKPKEAICRTLRVAVTGGNAPHQTCTITISESLMYDEHGVANNNKCYLRYRTRQAMTLIRRSHALIAEGCAGHLYTTRSTARLLCDHLDTQDRLLMVHGPWSMVHTH